MPRIAIARLRLAAVFVLLMPALVACSGSRKPEATVATDERSGVQSRLDAMMRVASPCTGAVLVSNAGKVIYKGLVGPPDATSRAGVTTGSRFLIGSLTKQFTAVLVLQQVERGKLNLEDAITKYLPDYPATGHAVTLHHLLSHTSGVPSYTDLPSFRLDGQQLYSPEEIVAEFRDLPLSFTPGSGSEYSNSGYALLGLILERVTGKTYRELLQENILKPAGMNQTGYDVQAFESGKMAPGHTRSADQNTLSPVTAGYVGPISHSYAAGGIYSTVEDMFLFDRALAD
jgi:CubicO group peptidase (beta-lactamase class C family)